MIMNYLDVKSAGHRMPLPIAAEIQNGSFQAFGKH